jgi:hypothetical protein
MSEHLHHKFAVLHRSLLHGKLPRNLHWSDALELIAHLGSVRPTESGEFAFVVGAQREFFRRPHTSELGVEEVSRLRRLLKAAESDVPSLALAHAGRMIVVIDHHGAHILRALDGAGSRTQVTVEPYDPHHFHHHLIHRKEAHYRGDRVPEEASFYEEVAQALVPAEEIVLIGHATGTSSAGAVLVEYLKKHHPEVYRKIMVNETADLSALSRPEMEAIAERHM